MTIEEKKEYLQGYGAAVQRAGRLNAYLEELEELKEDVNRLKHFLLCTDALSRHMEQIKAFEIKIRQSVREPVKICENVAASVNALTDEIEKDILTYRYIKGYTWEQIAEELQYSVTNIHRIHRKALEHFKGE